MKKNRLLSIVLALVIVMCVLPFGSVSVVAASTTVKDGIYTGFSASRGTYGTGSNEAYYMLVDGDLSSKWCVTSLANPTYIEFSSSFAFVPSGYILTTGGDTGSYPGRNPSGWVLKAKNEGDENWTTLADVENDTVLQAADTTSFRFALRNTSSYQQFRLDIKGTREGGVFQLSEFQFIGGIDLIHDLADFSYVEGSRFYKYTGEEITPDLRLYASDGELLEKGVDYTAELSPSPVKDKGNYTVTFTGISPYTGTKTFDFSVDDGYKYLDENGTEQYCDTFEVLTGGGAVTLGKGNGTVTWYVVNSDVTYSGPIKLSGDVRLILVDGKTVTVDTADRCILGADSSDPSHSGALTVYAQSAGDTSGTLRAVSRTNRTVSLKSLTLNGGNIHITRTDRYDAVDIGGDVRFNGGKLTVDGGSGRLYYAGTLFISRNFDSDSICAGEYCYNGINFLKPFKFEDNTGAFSGEMSGDMISVLGGKTLVPATLSSVTLETAENGSISKSSSFAQAGYYDGETVTLTSAPDLGYILSSVTATKTGDPAVTVELSGSGKTRTFTMPAFPVTVTAEFAENPNDFDLIVPSFDTLYEDYTAQDPKAISLCGLRKAIEISSVTLDEEGAKYFVLNKTSGTSLAAGEVNETYTAQPKSGLSAGTYSATVTAAYGNGGTMSDELSFTVLPHELTVSVPGFYEGEWAEGYSSGPLSCVFIKNSGSKLKTITSAALSGENKDCFTLQHSYGYTVEPGANNTWSYLLSPKTGLAAGKYPVTITVYSDDGETASCEETFTVLSATYGMSVSAPVFEDEYYSYSYAPAHYFTVTYTGNTPTRVTDLQLAGDDADKFTLEGSLDWLYPWSYLGHFVPAEYAREISIRPDAALPPGTYTATLTIKNAGGETASADVSFTVRRVPLTVAANSGTIIYGQSPANYGSVISGFVNGETEEVLGGSLTYSYDYRQFGDVGVYRIIPGGLTSDNYEILFRSGSLFVEQKELGLEWNDEPLTFSGEAQAPKAAVSGLVNGDEVTVTVGGEQVDAGEGYTAEASGLLGDKAGNYRLPNERTVEFSIGKAEAPSLDGVRIRRARTLPAVYASVSGIMPYNAGALTFSAGTPVSVGSVSVSEFTVSATGFVSAKISGGAAGDVITLPVSIASSNYKDTTAVVTVTLADPERPFVDVSEDNWFYDAVYYCYDRDYFRGTDPTHFTPGGTMTRAMFATVLCRFAGEPRVAGTVPFSDAEDGSWYSSAVIWAAREGIIRGYGNGKFGPDDPLTREQMVTLLWRYCGMPSSGAADLSLYSDADSISDWAKDAFLWATDAGVIRGKGGGILDPKGTAVRAEIAQLFKSFDGLTR